MSKCFANWLTLILKVEPTQNPSKKSLIKFGPNNWSLFMVVLLALKLLPNIVVKMRIMFVIPK